MAASQKNCILVKLKPICGRRTTTALMTNQVEKESSRQSVVIASVRQAIALPVSFQKAWFSTSHFSSIAIKVSLGCRR